jgi:hypothetical protein
VRLSCCHVPPASGLAERRPPAGPAPCKQRSIRQDSPRSALPRRVSAPVLAPTFLNHLFPSLPVPGAPLALPWESGAKGVERCGFVGLT